MKKILWIGITLVIMAGIAVYARSRSAGPVVPEKIEETAVVKRGPIRRVISTTGRVVSNRDVEIKCKASGEVILLPFDVSQIVKIGDLLLEIDPIDEQRNVRQAEITLAASKARLAQAKQNLVIAEKNVEILRDKSEANLKSAQAKATDEKAKADRMKELLNKKLISQEEYETSMTSEVQASVALDNSRIQLEDVKVQELQLVVQREDVKLSEAQVEKDDISLAMSKKRLQETKIFSPIDGVVAMRDVQIGQIISSGITNIGGGTAVMTLSDLSRIFVLASVDESDIGGVLEGQSAQITLDAYPNLKINGQVLTIAVQGVNTSNVVTFEVKIEVLDEHKDWLKSEMTANVDIVSASKEDALLVPSEAVLIRQNQRYVTVVMGPDKKEERPVKVGINDFTHIEILEGVQEGEAVRLYKEELQSRWNNGSNQGGGPPPPGGGPRR